MRLISILVTISLLIASGFAGTPQDQTATTSLKVLQIHRDFVRLGKEPQYGNGAAQAAATSVKESSPIPYLTISSLSGQSETWFMIWYQSYDEIDKLREESTRRNALATELRRILWPNPDLVTGAENLFAVYRDDLSQGAGLDIAKARFFSITIARVAPGHISDFEEIQKINKAAHTKAGVVDSHAVYQVSSGTTNGTFLILTPMHLLAEMDESIRHGRKYTEALGEGGS